MLKKYIAINFSFNTYWKPMLEYWSFKLIGILPSFFLVIQGCYNACFAEYLYLDCTLVRLRNKFFAIHEKSCGVCSYSIFYSFRL